MLLSWLFPSPHAKTKTPANPFRTPQIVPKEDYLLSHPVFQLVYCTAVGSLLVAIVWCMVSSSSSSSSLLLLLTQHPSSSSSSQLVRPHFAPQLRGRPAVAPLFRTPLLRRQRQQPSMAAAPRSDPAQTWEDAETDDTVLRDTAPEHLYYYEQEQQQQQQQADDVYDEFGLFATHQLASSGDDDDHVQVVQRRRHHHHHHHQALPPSTVESILPNNINNDDDDDDDDRNTDLMDERQE